MPRIFIVDTIPVPETFMSTSILPWNNVVIVNTFDVIEPTKLAPGL